MTTTTVNDHDQVSPMDKTMVIIIVNDGDCLFQWRHTNNYCSGATDDAGRGQSQWLCYIFWILSSTVTNLEVMIISSPEVRNFAPLQERPTAFSKIPPIGPAGTRAHMLNYLWQQINPNKHSSPERSLNILSTTRESLLLNQIPKRFLLNKRCCLLWHATMPANDRVCACTCHENMVAHLCFPKKSSRFPIRSPCLAIPQRLSPLPWPHLSLHENDKISADFWCVNIA